MAARQVAALLAACLLSLVARAANADGGAEALPLAAIAPGAGAGDGLPAEDAERLFPVAVPGASALPTKALPRAPVSAAQRTQIIAALRALERNDAVGALTIAQTTREPVLTKLVTWLHMRQQNSGRSFAEIVAFLRANPDWPDRNLLQKRAEEALAEGPLDPQALNWLQANPPVSAMGRIRLAEALIRGGRLVEGRNWLRQVWINDDLPPQARGLRERHADAFGVADHVARLDRLLWDGQLVGARAMLALVDPGQRALAEARIGLQASAPNVAQLLGRVPVDLQREAGLQFDRLRWRRQRNQDEPAQAILLDPQLKLGPRPEKWWLERRSQVYNLLESNQHQPAYRIAQRHGMQPGGQAFAEAEWLAGWIALRYQKDARLAYLHFDRVYRAVKLPVSLARGAFWAGRAAGAMNDWPRAKQWFALATVYPHTYYGQLAIEAVADGNLRSLPLDPKPTAYDSNAFHAREIVRAAALLAAGGALDRAQVFLMRAIETAQSPADRVLALQIAKDLGRPEMVVRLGKHSAQTGVPLVELAYPVLNFPRGKAEQALLHAITRQESEFDPNAISSAGARGLMQLMPATAKDVSRGIGRAYTLDKLTDDPLYNLELGSTYLSSLIGSFRGSYVLAVAGYNAGPSRVQKWIKEFGDPRQPDVDAIDWVEQIPINETRNYVQRVLEGLQVYRHLLGGEPVRLAADLRREGPAVTNGCRC